MTWRLANPPDWYCFGVAYAHVAARFALEVAWVGLLFLAIYWFVFGFPDFIRGVSR